MQDDVVAKLERWLRAQVETHRSLSQLEPLESRAHIRSSGLIAPPPPCNGNTLPKISRIFL